MPVVATAADSFDRHEQSVDDNQTSLCLFHPFAKFIVPNPLLYPHVAFDL